MKVLCRHQPNLSMSSELCSVVFINGNLQTVYEEQLVFLAIVWVPWKKYETSLANNLISLNIIPVFEAPFADKRWSLGFLYLPLFGELI